MENQDHSASRPTTPAHSLPGEDPFLQRISQLFDERMSPLAHEFRELALRQQSLEATVAPLLAPAPVPTTAPDPATNMPVQQPDTYFPVLPALQLRVDIPLTFDGNARHLTSFIAQSQEIFNLYASSFPNDRFKTYLMSTKLTGPARSWYESLASNDTVLQSVERFIIALRNQFTDPTLERAAFRSLKTIKQKGSAIQYANEFRKHLSLVKIDDFSCRELFLAGLRPSVQKHIAGETFLTFQAMIDRATAVDYVHYDLDGADQSRPFAPAPRTSRSPPRLHHTPSFSPSPVIDNAEDMEIGAITAPVMTDADIRQHLAKLTSKEAIRAFCMKLGLCFYCKQRGHSAVNCPNKHNPKN
jgi:hypothetical protein